MSKKKKVLMMVLAALIGLLLLACAAFYVVFDVPNWQKLDASKLSALAQTSSMYDAQGELMSEPDAPERRKDHSAQVGRNPSRLPNRSGIQQG